MLPNVMFIRAQEYTAQSSRILLLKYDYSFAKDLAKSLIEVSFLELTVRA
jgi:hypothetical protein